MRHDAKHHPLLFTRIEKEQQRAPAPEKAAPMDGSA